MTPLQIGLLCAAGVVIGSPVIYNLLPDALKAKLPAWLGGLPTLDQVAGTVFGALKKLQGQATLSPPGRSVLSDVVIFLEEPIMLFPDSPERKAAIDGRKAIYALFGSSPVDPADPAPTTVVKTVT